MDDSAPALSPPGSARTESGSAPVARKKSTSTTVTRLSVKDGDEGDDDEDELAGVPKKGSAAWEWAQKQTEEDEQKRAKDEDVSASAKSAMAAVREKERQQLEEARRQEEIRKKETDEDALKERRRLDKLARERKAQEEEDRRKDEETRAQRAVLDAAKREREAKELAVKEAKMREENAKRRAEEDKVRQEEEAARKRRDEAARKLQEDERRERDKRDAERAAERARERQEFEARREAQLRKWREENEKASREMVLQMSERDREELARTEEERARAQERHERTKQVWAERLRDAEERVRQRYSEVLDRVHRAEDAVSSRKASYAGAETEEWLLNAVHAKSFAALAGVRGLGEQVQVRLALPTWVVVGAKSRAKANIVDALLGMPVFKGADVVRTFHIQLCYDGDAETSPIVTFADAPSAQLDAFRLPSEVASRNVADSGLAPCVVTIRYKFYWNMLFVVTPDLPEPILPSVYDPERWPAVMREILPGDRMILWVDRCDAEPPLGAQFGRMIGLADAQHRRSLLVLNGLSDVLAELTLTPEVNAFLGQSVAIPVYFVSYSTEKNTPADLTVRLQSDAAALKRLKAFGEFDARVGVKRLAECVQNLTHEMYQRNLAPTILSQINALASKLSVEQHRVEEQIASIHPEQLRGFASRYLTHYLQHFRAALLGSGGDPTVNGETLAEEREAATGHADRWTVNARLSLTVSTKDVPQGGTKLLGRAAFMRLLVDLSGAVQKAPLAATPASDTALLANSGPARSGREPDFAFAASDVASKRAQEVLRPLLIAAVQRAAHIAKQLTYAAEGTVATERRRGEHAAVITHAPFFCATIRNVVHDFVDLHASRCTQAVDDEFRATAFLPLSLLKQTTPTTTEEEEELARVGVMATSVLEELRRRILEAGKLILVEHLLEPLNDEVQKHVTAKMALVRSDEIEASLEPEAARARLLEEQCRLQQETALASEYLRIFQTHIADF